MKKISIWFREEIDDYKLLLRNIPALTVSFFILSVVCANLMANKELITFKYLAVDCGFVFSWMMFLCEDVICKRWGARASIKISILALGVNLLICGIFYLLSLAPGMWGEYYRFFEFSDKIAVAVNSSLNATFGGAWYVVLGSGLAFLVSSIVNALINVSIGKLFKKNNFGVFAIRSYISTMIGQLVDNLIFATVVSKLFFGWTWTQVVLCSVFGAVFELLAEVLFSGFGYRVVQSWEREQVGQQYFDHLNQKSDAE